MKKILVYLLALALTFGTMASCSNESRKKEEKKSEITGKKEEAKKEEAKKENTESQIQAQDDILTGDLSISGSTSVEPIGVACADAFMALNPGVQVTYEGIGSSSGIKNAKDHITMLGTASRNLKEKEKAWGLKEVVIANDGVAVVVHPQNEIAELTLEQVQKIFKGEITNWSQVGGKDAEIVVVSREDGSGTRGAFEEIVGFEDELTGNATIYEGNGGVQQAVAGNPSSIGYVSFSYLNETVKDVLVDGGNATAADVGAGKYPISRPFIVIYDEAELNDVSQAYLDFVLSGEGQAIVEENGGLKVN